MTLYWALTQLAARAKATAEAEAVRAEAEEERRRAMEEMKKARAVRLTSQAGICGTHSPCSPLPRSLIKLVEKPQSFEPKLNKRDRLTLPHLPQTLVATLFRRVLSLLLLKLKLKRSRSWRLLA